MKKVIVFGMILVALLLVSCVDNSQFYESQTKEGIECLENSDCSNEEICSNNKCKDDCPQLDLIKTFYYHPPTYPSETEIWLNQSDNNKIVDEYNVSWNTHVECVRGSEERENINYWYCGKSLTFWESYIYLEKTMVDSEGNIIQKVKKKALNVYDDNFDFVKTICYS